MAGHEMDSFESLDDITERFASYEARNARLDREEHTGWMHVGADGQLTEVTVEELFGLGQLVNTAITAEETVLAPAPADRIYRNAQGWWYRRDGVPHGPHMNLIEAVADRTQYRYDLAQRQAD